MPPILGNIIVLAILAVIVFFCGRNVIRDIKHELSGGSCASCPGACSGGGCSGCSGCAGGIQQKKR
ncbi:MAG: FeoB-associated Cys-rich membrane protein [Lachnospiraceae bacterium]|nr:FeoB-associated Cys-rich membrane protein [Lachnospiraceae bacterium]